MGEREQQSNRKTLYEVNTGLISNSSLRVQFNYNFTEGSEEALNYTQNEILFLNGTSLIWYKMTMPKGWNNSNNNANTNNNNLPLSRKQKKPLDKKASLEAHLTMQECKYRKKNSEIKDQERGNRKN